MKKKSAGNQAGESHSGKARQWASQVLSITENTGRGGIEILFDAEPSPQLQPKLRAMSFRNSRTKSMWYGERTEEARKFAEKVMQVLPANIEGPELLLSPSFEALKTNLERKAFSFVIFSLKDGQTTSYVVFEPSKPKAEVIAMNFARRTFEDEPSALAVLPKTHIKEARTLFDEGKIIHPDDSTKTLPVNTKETKHIMSDLSTTKQVTGEKVPVKSILLTTESVNRRPDYKAGVALSNWTEANAYVKSKIGKHISDVYYKIRWQNGDLFGGMIDLEPSEFYDRIDEPFSNHLTTYLNNYSRVTSKDPLYDKESVEYALHLLQHCQFEDVSETSPRITAENEQIDVQETSTDKQRQLFNQATDKFFKWVVDQDDPKMHPEQVTSTLMKTWLHEHMPELNEVDVSYILERYQGIQKFLKAGTRKSSLLHPFDTIYKKILKVIPNLIDHIKAGKTAGKSKVDPEGGLMALNYDFVRYDKNGHPIIALSHYFTQEGDRVADPDMTIRLIPEKEIAEAMTFQDQFRYQEVYTEKDGKSFVYPKLRKDLNSFLNTWLTNIIQQGHKIDLSEEEEDEPNYYRKAWELLTQLVPDLRNPTGKALSGTATVSGKGTIQQRGLTCTLAQRPGGDYEVSLIDSIGANDRLHFGIAVNAERQTALVDYEWFRAGNARIYDRGESQRHITQRGGDVSEEMTKGLIRWLEEVVSLGVTVPLIPPLNAFAESEARNSAQEKALWDLIQHVLPDLKLIPDKEQKSQTGIGEDAGRFIRISLGPRGYIGDFDLHFTDTLKGMEQIRADVLLNPKEKRAEVYSIYQGGDWALRAVRKSDENALSGHEVDEVKEMNAVLMAWLRSLIDEGITLTLEPESEKEISDPAETKQPVGAILTTNSDEKKEEDLPPGQDYEILNLLYHWLEEHGDQAPENLTAEQFASWMMTHFPEVDSARQQQIWKSHLSTRKTINDGLKRDRTQDITQAKVLLSGTPVFDPAVMASLISRENYLLNAWSLSHPKKVLQQKTFNAEDISHLRAFFGIYVQEDKPMQVKYLDLYREKHTKAVDLTFQETGMPLPNVLVPNGTKEPFYSHDWRTYDMRSLLQNSFVSLTELNNVTLNSASPLQLYELAQLGNPASYRIDVSQEKLIDIWRKRGKELFDILGFPTHPAYPYADLIAGYENMISLRDLLNDRNTTGDEWWIAAALYRPIANLDKAGEILDEMLANKKREKQSYMTADEQRPRPNYKQRVEQMDRTISYIEESQAVLQAYFEQTNNNQTSQSRQIHRGLVSGETSLDTEQSEDDQSQKGLSLDTKLPGGEELRKVGPDPLTNDSGVYTKQTAGENLEEIIIPIPKTAQYTAEIRIAKTSAGTYKKGITAMKNFGDAEGMGSAPSIYDTDFPSRNAAIKAALVEHEKFLERLLASKDSILDNEEKKNKQLSMALKALIDFARGKGIELDDEQTEDNDQFVQSADEVLDAVEDSHAAASDPLANEDGYYTSFSAGKYFETLEIPMPKSSSFHANVYLVKTSAGNYKEGITCGKYFGDISYHSEFPNVKNESYPTRKSALKASLLDLEMQLETLLGRKDTILNNEATKHRRLTLAVNALKKFATENGISLKAVPDPEESPNDFIEGLEAAYWREKEDKEPQHLAMILDIAFHHRRLRDALAIRLDTLPLLALKQIVDDLVFRFPARVSLEGYAKSFAIYGQSEEEKKRRLLVAYVDDLISFNDPEGGQQFPVMTYLIDVLFSGSPKLADVPVISTNTPTKRKRSGGQSQHQLNKEIEVFIDQKDKDKDLYDESDKNYLRQYTGSGGLLTAGATGRGTLYEYYTPDDLVKKMWDIAYHYGYDGGSILEPAVGTGNFLKYAPVNATISAYETNHYAARIAQLLYPHAQIIEKAFETLFFTGNIHLKDKFVNPGYSLVIGNPPYGAFNGKYAGLGEKQYTGATEYDQYFTLRSLDLLKPGGLLVFLVPSYFMLSMQKYDKTKKAMISKAEWVDGYRLPKSIFPNTDVGTDIIVLRKRM